MTIQKQPFNLQASRRQFLQQTALASGLSLYAIEKTFGELPPTAPQTKGPFYPIPDIDKQKYFDADLTRLSQDSPVADGEQIVIQGVVVDTDDKPLDDVIVEVWQACATGRYNHPQDKNDRPADPNFQYWAKMLTKNEGAFSFRTIQPGKYPGRTPHIHYRIIAPGRPELVTQMYFDAHTEENRKDGIYMNLKPEQRLAVTVGLDNQPVSKEPNAEKLLTGSFKIVLGPQNNPKTTQPM